MARQPDAVLTTRVRRASRQPALDPSTELLILMVDSCASMLVVVNASGVVVRANPACADMAGRSVDAMLGNAVWDAMPGAAGTEATRELWEKALEDGESGTHHEQVVIDPLGNRRRLRWTFVSVADSQLDSGGSPRYLIATGVDVTRERLAEGIWRQRAETDPLTGLANRAVFSACIAEQADIEIGIGGGVMFCDLDGFKAINDTYGHSVGDDVLVEVASRLRRCVREGDLVARFGGDEFAILLPEVGELEMSALASRVEAAIARPMRLGMDRGSIGISVGYCVLLPGQDTVDVLREADNAMYRAKSKRAARQ